MRVFKRWICSVIGHRWYVGPERENFCLRCGYPD